MRSIGFKMATLMTALMSTMTVYAKSQDVGGRVINENGTWCCCRCPILLSYRVR